MQATHCVRGKRPGVNTVVLQGAASSVAATNKGADMLLAYDEELPPEDCAEGADESDDGGARRMLRSHAAAAAAAASGGAGFKRAVLQVRRLKYGTRMLARIDVSERRIVHKEIWGEGLWAHKRPCTCCRSSLCVAGRVLHGSTVVCV